MRPILALALAFGLLTACAGPPAPRAPDQTAVALISSYTVAATRAAAYTSRPDADPRMVATIRRLDNEAYAAKSAVVADVQAGRPVDAARLALAQTTVDALQRRLALVN